MPHKPPLQTEQVQLFTRELSAALLDIRIVFPKGMKLCENCRGLICNTLDALCKGKTSTKGHGALKLEIYFENWSQEREAMVKDIVCVRLRLCRESH